VTDLAAPVIAAAQQRATRVLVDRATIWRDSHGTRDDVLDPVTLSYEPVGDAQAVATGVPCKANHQLRNSQQGEAGQATVIAEYVLAFAAGTDVRAGDRVEVTHCEYEPALAGMAFDVVEPMHGTFAVLQRVRARLRQSGVDL
jgi:hypothetical protein